MRAYDGSRCRPTPELQERTRQALEAFMRCLIQQDVDGLTKLLADDVRTMTDGAGEYTALPRPLLGRPQVMRLYLQVARRRMEGARFDTLLLNGLPALTIEFATTVRRQAPCALLRCELNPEGRIHVLHAILGNTNPFLRFFWKNHIPAKDIKLKMRHFVYIVYIEFACFPRPASAERLATLVIAPG